MPETALKLGVELSYLLGRSMSQSQVKRLDEPVSVVGIERSHLLGSQASPNERDAGNGIETEYARWKFSRRFWVATRGLCQQALKRVGSLELGSRLLAQVATGGRCQQALKPSAPSRFQTQVTRRNRRPMPAGIETGIVPGCWGLLRGRS